MNDTNPATLFGFGTWERITNRFLYCADTASGQTGGSTSHAHNYGIRYAGFYNSIHGLNNNDNLQIWDGSHWVDAHVVINTWTSIKSTNSINTPQGTATVFEMLANTSSSDNLPPYITVYAWQRTE